jgi:HemK-like putative methylase
LIPRAETETWSSNLATYLLNARIVSDKPKLSILDLCSGSGAIALNLHHALRNRTFPRSTPASQVSAEQLETQKPMDLQIMGIDVSEAAIDLSERNRDHNIANNILTYHASSEVCFRRMDILKEHGAAIKEKLSKLLSNPSWEHGKRWDILVANPPYIAPDDYAAGGRTESSVRDYEPQLALVPPSPEGSLHAGDTFYPKLLKMAKTVSADLIVLELGDDDQASRVRNMVHKADLTKQRRLCVETWYDDGMITVHTDYEGKELPRPVSVRRTGKEYKPTGAKPTRSARVVAIWRQNWASRRMQSLNLDFSELKKMVSASWTPLDTLKARKVDRTEVQNSIRRSKRKAAVASYAKSLRSQGNFSEGPRVSHRSTSIMDQSRRKTQALQHD